MDTNFIYTGGGLNAMHLRAIRSAMATQRSDRTILWWNGERPDLSVLPAGLETREVSPRCSAKFQVEATVDLPSDHWRRTVVKDILLWELAEEHGGLFLDLDTTCLFDVTHLLAGHGLVSPIDVPWDGDANTSGWRNTAILLARAGSDPVRACAEEMRRRVNDSSQQRVFFLGPKLLTEVMNARGLDQVFTPPYRMLGAFGGGVESAAYLHGEMALPAQARVVHWFSSSVEMRPFTLGEITTRVMRAPVRERIGELLNPKGFVRGAEVGVQRGEFSRHILAGWDGHLTLVDAWRDFPAEEYHDSANVGELEQLRNLATTIANLSPFRGRWDIVRDLSVEAAKQFPDGHFDFVYLDANHSRAAVLEDVRAWAPKVRRGGFLCGHDYLDAELPNGSFGVRGAVNDFFGRPPDRVSEEGWPSFFYQL